MLNRRRHLDRARAASAVALVWAFLVFASIPVLAAVNAATPEQLAAAMDIDPDDLVSATLDGSATAVGVVDSVMDGFPSRGGTFAIITNGLAADDDGTQPGNQSGSANANTNVQGNDLVQLVLELAPPLGATCLAFDVAFHSEEFPEYVGGGVSDAFTAELNATDLGIDNDSGQVTSSTNFALGTMGELLAVDTAFNVSNDTGNAYDMGTSLLQAATPIDPEAETVTLYLSIQDVGDSVVDSAALLDNFRWLAGECEPGLIATQGLLSPAAQSKIVGEGVAVTATLTDSEGEPVEGVPVTFEILDGPNAGILQAINTGASGTASFGYTSLDVGFDRIGASFPVGGSQQEAIPVVVGWGLGETIFIDEPDWGESIVMAEALPGNDSGEVIIAGHGDAHVIGYLALQNEGVKLYDLTSPQSPIFVAAFDPGTCSAEGVSVDFFADDVGFIRIGNLDILLISAGPCGVFLVDVTNPLGSAFTPTLLQQIDTPTWAEAVVAGAEANLLLLGVADYDAVRGYSVVVNGDGSVDPAVFEGELLASDLAPADGALPILNLALAPEDEGEIVLIVATKDGLRTVVLDLAADEIVSIGEYLHGLPEFGSDTQDVHYDPVEDGALAPFWAEQLAIVVNDSVNGPSLLASACPTGGAAQPDCPDPAGARTAFLTAIRSPNPDNLVYATEGPVGVRALTREGDQLVPGSPSDPILIPGDNIWPWDIKAFGCILYVTFGDSDDGTGGLAMTDAIGCGGRVAGDSGLAGPVLDADQDGWADSVDNCIVVPNPNQTDVDQDGYGNRCDADLDNDGQVGLADFAQLIAAFGAIVGDPAYDPLADLDGGGGIGLGDYGILVQQFGGAPGVSGLGCSGTVPCTAP